MPYRILCHQCRLASEALGIEVTCVLVDDAPALSSARIRVLQTGNNLVHTSGARVAARFRINSPTESTALLLVVVVT